MSKKETPYHIYGRSSYEQPLTFVKEIVIEAAVKEETLADVGQDDWIELIAIPANSLIHVIGKEAES